MGEIRHGAPHGAGGRLAATPPRVARTGGNPSLIKGFA